MLAICSELELNEATSNGVIMSPPSLFCMVNVRGNVIFAEGLNVQIECLTDVSDMFRIRVE